MASTRTIVRPMAIRCNAAVIIAWLALWATGTEAVSEYCSQHQYAKASASNDMQFTKEVVSREYAKWHDYKSLHCCAKGYQSIEWFMNGIPAPWSKDTSALILDPRAENQTIYAYNINYSDAGNYTCVLRNATHRHEHRIELHVRADPPNTPLSTFKPHDVSIEIGQPARLFCEAFVGHSKLPDAQSVVTWMQVSENGRRPVADAVQIQVNRDEMQIVGAYLHLTNVQPHHYGQFVCIVDAGNAANRLEMFVQISGPPTQASDAFWLTMSPLHFVLGGALLLLGLLVLVRYTMAWLTLWRKRGGDEANGAGTTGVMGGMLAGGVGAAMARNGRKQSAGCADKLMHYRNVV